MYSQLSEVQKEVSVTKAYEEKATSSLFVLMLTWNVLFDKGQRYFVATSTAHAHSRLRWTFSFSIYHILVYLSKRPKPARRFVIYGLSYLLAF